VLASLGGSRFRSCLWSVVRRGLHPLNEKGIWAGGRASHKECEASTRAENAREVAQYTSCTHTEDPHLVWYLVILIAPSTRSSIDLLTHFQQSINRSQEPIKSSTAAIRAAHPQESTFISSIMSEAAAAAAPTEDGDRKRKSEDEAGAAEDDEELEEQHDDDDDDDDSHDDDSYDDDSEASDDDEELEALQRLSEQIQEAKETNQKLKQTLLAHRSKKLKADDTDGGAAAAAATDPDSTGSTAAAAAAPDNSQRDLVAALFASRAAQKAAKEGDTIV